jgi:hypothetical protein
MKSTTSILPRLFTPLVLCLLFLTLPSFSQPSATSQTITLQVAELNALSVTNHLLTVSGEVKPEIRYRASAATRLIWTSNGENRKITVKKKSSGGVLSITVEDVDGDHLAPLEKELRDGTTFDLVSNVSRKAGGCTIRFAAVSFDANSDNGMQNVIYTITSS